MGREALSGTYSDSARGNDSAARLDGEDDNADAAEVTSSQLTIFVRAVPHR